MLKILYIEDDPQQVEIVKLFLSRENLQVLNARDGINGLRLIREEQPAMVFIDINLPAMSGLEVAQCARADASVAHIPLIALTSTMKFIHQGVDIETLFDAYLSKPIMRADMVTCVHSFLSQSQPQI